MLILITQNCLTDSNKAMLKCLDEKSVVVLSKDGVYLAHTLSKLAIDAAVYLTDAKMRGVDAAPLKTLDDEALVQLSVNHKTWVCW